MMFEVRNVTTAGDPWCGTYRTKAARRQWAKAWPTNRYVVARARDADALPNESNLKIPAAEWLREQFEYEWCAECGRDHRHHTALGFLGNWFARCDLPAVEDVTGAPMINPENYVD